MCDVPHECNSALDLGSYGLPRQAYLTEYTSKRQNLFPYGRNQSRKHIGESKPKSVNLKLREDIPWGELMRRKLRHADPNEAKGNRPSDDGPQSSQSQVGAAEGEFQRPRHSCQQNPCTRQRHTFNTERKPNDEAANNNGRKNHSQF